MRSPSRARTARGRGAFGRTLERLVRALDEALDAEEIARRRGLLQSLDPRAKVVGLFALLLAASLSREIGVILAVFAVAVALAFASKIGLGTLALRAWAPSLIFTLLLAVPAIVVTPGRPALDLPFGLAVTDSGLRSAALLLARVETAVTCTTLLVLTTPWTHVLKALRVLGVPAVFVVILGMAHRYVFVLLGSARDLFEARQSRTVGRLSSSERRRVAAATAGVLLEKSFHLSNEVYLAMLSRGFRGEVYLLDEFRMRARDWIALGALVSTSAIAIWAGI